MSSLVFVDTSIWIEALRGSPGVTSVRLRELIDEDRVALAVPVRLEILSGASREQYRRLASDLSALPTFHPSVETWREIERWTELAVAAGERFGVGDLLIGAIAREHEGEVWSRDGDFARLRALGLIELLDPAG